jgi:hypothetical protein
MNIVQPGSATTKSNDADVEATCTWAVRRCPATGSVTLTGTSTTLRPTAVPLSPSPSTRTRTASVTPSSVTRTSCTGASAGPTKSSVDSAEMTCIPAPYGRMTG